MNSFKKEARCCVIIVTFNAKKWIEKCLSNFAKSNYTADIVIVDNDSKDETIELINKAFKPKKLIETGANLGFGKANNVGIEYAFREGYEYFFLLNQDAYVNKNTIGHLVESMSANGEIGILSPIHLNGGGDNLDYGFKSGIKSKQFVKDFSDNTWKNELYHVPFVNAAGWMLSRATIEKVGLFHPLFFHYGEDKNYASRVNYIGLKIMIDRRASIRHDRENRGYNPLIHDPHKNHEREAWQILLNPSNPSSYFLLLLAALKNMLVVTHGWGFSRRRVFIKDNIRLFRAKYDAMKEFGGREFNPLIN